MQIQKLKEKLQEILDNLNNNYNDNDEVEVVSNTYFLRNSSYWMQFGRIGFIDLENPTGDSDEDE